MDGGERSIEHYEQCRNIARIDIDSIDTIHETAICATAIAKDIAVEQGIQIVHVSEYCYSRWDDVCCYAKEYRRAIKRSQREDLSCFAPKCMVLESDTFSRFKLCSGCKMAYYCCRRCQKNAWPLHKIVCNRL